jgi:hypothetical protein
MLVRGRYSTQLPALSAVVDSDTTDSAPDFDVTLPGAAAANWVINVDYSIANADTWSDYFDHTFTGAEIIAEVSAVIGVTELANATYDFRLRLEYGGAVSAWFTIEDFVIAA